MSPLFYPVEFYQNGVSQSQCCFAWAFKAEFCTSMTQGYLGSKKKTR